MSYELRVARHTTFRRSMGMLRVFCPSEFDIRIRGVLTKVFGVQLHWKMPCGCDRRSVADSVRRCGCGAFICDQCDFPGEYGPAVCESCDSAFAAWASESAHHASLEVVDCDW